MHGNPIKETFIRFASRDSKYCCAFQDATTFGVFQAFRIFAIFRLPMKRKRDRDIGLIVIAAIAITFVFVAWYYTYSSLKDLEKEDRGTFGDMFGAVNALFSGLAFVGIIITILLQRKELSLQRQELEETRAELRRTADAQDAQNKFLLNQQYQTTFFSLMSGHSELIESFMIWEKRGFEGLAEFYNKMLMDVGRYANWIERRSFPNKDATSDNPAFSLLFNEDFLYSIFDDLRTLIEFIDDKLEDSSYHEILYNRLTVYEKYLIGLYCDCFDDQYSRFFKKHTYNFKRFYDGHNYRYQVTKDSYFPEVNIRREKMTNVFRSNIDENSALYLFYLDTGRDLFIDPLYLEKVIVHGSKFHNGRHQAVFSVPIDTHLVQVNNFHNQGMVEINLMKNIYKDILSFNQEGNYNVNCEFIFKYNNLPYVVTYSTAVYYGNNKPNPDTKMNEMMYTVNHDN